MGIAIAGIGLFFCGFQNVSKNTKSDSEERFVRGILLVNSIAEQRLCEEVSSIKELVEENSQYNDEIAFLIDLRIMSGKNRFFVFDLKNNKIIDQGLVAHGLGSGSGIYSELKFSNDYKSMCTSLGKYYVGQSVDSEFGKAYTMHGFEDSNSNAFARNMLLHQFDKVPYEEQDESICFSKGSPMLNRMFYGRLEKIIDTSRGKIILDIYY